MPETAREELARMLGAYPKEALTFIRDGMAVASKLSDDSRKLILKAVIENLKRGKNSLAASLLRPIAKVSEREAEQLAATYSLTIGLLSESGASPEDLVSAAKGALFAPEQEATAKSIAEAICASREEIKAGIERALLANGVLPSLRDFEIAVDARVEVVDGKLKTLVPVAIAHVDTDAAHIELWVQLSKGDVEDIIKKLSQCLEDMKLAETLELRKN